MKLNVVQIKEYLEKQMTLNLDTEIQYQDLGYVLQVGDGVAHVCGLNSVKIGEVVVFASSVKGIVFGLEVDVISVIIMSADNTVSQGDVVKRTGDVVKTPVGMCLLGRVVNALGEAIDDTGDIVSDTYRAVEISAPKIMDRKSVSRSLYTGIKVIDTIIPIGKGQRELIIGDRKTGKTDIVLSTILAQKYCNLNNICNKVYSVYVVIGQKRSDVARIVKFFKDFKILSDVVVVAATASDSVAMQFLAPYTGCAIAEYFRDSGKDALVIYDDLSKHAVAYRQISLLLRRSPGRGAYPGDIFYLHARLLERAAQLSESCGGGSLTALPIVETQNGNISDYIPTNIISITDGQIFLETELFHKGIVPAVNILLSVSRVGSSAQVNAMRKISSSLKLNLARFHEIVAFSKFSSDLDEKTNVLIKKGTNLVELLKQERYVVLSMEEQVVVLYLGVHDYLDSVNSSLIIDLEKKFLLYIKNHVPDILISIRNEGCLNKSTECSLKSLIKGFLLKYEY